MIYRFFSVVFAIFLLCAQPVFAQAINVSPDGPTIVELPSDAGSVIVGNPVHASVILDNPRKLMINAGVPGMTSIVVLDQKGKVIFNRPVVSSAPTGKLIRVQNACINGGDGCAANKIYYCAEGERCHDVALPQEETALTSGGEIAEEGGEE